MKNEEMGKWAFIAGLVIAVVAGLVSGSVMPTWIAGLAVLGIIVGFLNVTGKEVGTFLMAAITLLLVGGVWDGIAQSVGQPVLKNIWGYVVAFIAGAALIVALKEVFLIAKEK